MKTLNPTKGIYKRGEIYWIALQKFGKRKYISLETNDEFEAIRRAREIRKADIFESSPLTQAITNYIKEKSDAHIYTRPTCILVQNVLSEFSKNVTLRSVTEIRQSHIESHYKMLQFRIAETSAQIHMRTIRAFFSWCVKKRLTHANPCERVALVKIERPARLKFCNPSQRDLLIEQAPNDDLRFILYCGFHAGMRKNEIVESRVSWFDISQDLGSVHITSTETYRLHANEEHFVPLGSEFRNFLIRYLHGKKPDQFALRPATKHGIGRYRYDFSLPFNAFTTSLGLRWVTAHVMRHTFASIAVQRGISIFKVARWLGDGVAVVEKHYAHLAPSDGDIERIL